MNSSGYTKPIVLVFSAHDPSGAAGVQADIETIACTGCHCVSVITATTAQNTTRFDRLTPQDPARFRRQTEVLLSDLEFHACKIGMPGSIELIEIIAHFLKNRSDTPIVLDPIMAAGTGEELASKESLNRLMETLIPLTTVLTPNTEEAFALTDTDDRQAAADKFFTRGCKNVLITGADEDTPRVINTLFRNDQAPFRFEWERLPHKYHGSGCTLSSGITGFLARGFDVYTAVEKAQQYTWQTLKHGMKLGNNQWHPNRFFNYRNENVWQA
ncbi:MAG: hydroxymethylpyrimidine/phosphomethylpyrimidine kinase [Gammaproteobacteria bacterium]